ncbi:MAG: acyltransferase [Prevotellaceae bacterium]|jgi:hypothetical protein|nr:acyltransferase [Prevotellaceae bacterium]
MVHKKNFYSDELQSKVIDYLRFPLIIGVLFIHNATPNLVVNGQILGAEADMLFFGYCSKLFSQVLGRIAVPLFFFMSGFLFFHNIEGFNLQIYSNKLKTRAKTLLTPYLFWNFAVFALYYIMQNVPTLSPFSNREVDWHDFFSYFYNNSGNLKDSFSLELDKSLITPISYPFWFIRDLMVAVALTPVIYFLCKKTKAYILILPGISLFSGYWFNVAGFSIDCIFFFMAGACFGIHKRNLLNDFRKLRIFSFILYPLLALADLLKCDFIINIHYAGIITGIVFCFNLTAFLFEKKKIRSAPFLSAASFFVFAVHAPFLISTFRKISFMILQPESEFAITALYFLNVMFVALAALGIYRILRKFLPKFTSFITGGR